MYIPNVPKHYQFMSIIFAHQNGKTLRSEKGNEVTLLNGSASFLCTFDANKEIKPRVTHVLWGGVLGKYVYRYGL